MAEAPKILAVAALSLMVAACSIGDNPHFDAARPHHTPSGFQNPPDSPKSERTLLKWMGFVLGRLTADRRVELPPDHVLSRDAARRQLAAHQDSNRVTWIGHATTLVGLDGINILTNPVFSKNASPWPIAISRWVPPGLEIEDLPRIDVIVISHNHYDSFDLPSLRQLARRFPDVRVLVPLGLGPAVRGASLANVREMDWYDSETVGAVTLQSTPAIHASQRSLTDRNFTLWTGFLLRGKDLRVWFTGDTALGPLFDRVRERIGTADVALVPVGAYEPSWLMKANHTTPEEAAELARRLDARRAIGLHWGTFPLGEDPPLQTQRRFLATKTADFTPQMLRIGETVSLTR